MTDQVWKRCLDCDIDFKTRTVESQRHTMHQVIIIKESERRKYGA